MNGVTKLAPRTEVMNALDHALEKRLIYVQAPAGYGKTTAVRLWLQRARMNYAFLPLDEFDNKLSHFCSRLCALLLRHQPHNQLLAEIIGHPSFSSAPSEYTVRALEALDPEQRLVVVIDDLHIIDDRGILRFLPFLIRKLPEQLTLVIVSRNDLPVHLAEPMLRNEMALIGVDKLKFNSNEIHFFFESNRRPISWPQAEALYRFTDGWAIAVNALLLSGEEPSGQKLLHNHLSSFILNQVWTKWDQPTRDLMLKTSLVEELTPSLCQALTGEPESAHRLAKLVEENAFISVDDRGIYRFHGLFRFFLQEFLADQDPSGELRRQLQKAAGAWYVAQGDDIRAMEFFLQCGDEEGVVSALSMTFESDTPYFPVEAVLSKINVSTNEDLLERFPVLYSLKAWSDFLEGRPEEMAWNLDQYYRRLPEFVEKMPKQLLNLVFLRSFDFRISYQELEAEIRAMPTPPVLKSGAGTITQNMPLLHRASRDLSEYVGSDMLEKVERLRQTLGALFGRELDMLQDVMVAGLFYEQGEQHEALRYALQAESKLEDHFSPELKFCTRMILIYIYDALWRDDKAEEQVELIEQMIERDRSFFLSYNLKACLYRRRIEDGQIKAAEEWLDSYGSSPYEAASFYRIYGHFTSARAYIAVSNYDSAIILLKKLLSMSRTYRRPLDVIEAQILLSIAYWKKRRSFQNEAVYYLEQAVILAQQYGFTQLFANEGAELTNMLYRLQSRTVRQDYQGEVQGSFAKRVYLQAFQHAKHAKGLTGGQERKSLKFTERQKTVMRLLCRGNSYRQIAEEMGLKFSTIRSHIELIYKKLDVPNETEAILKIQELGLLDGEIID